MGGRVPATPTVCRLVQAGRLLLVFPQMPSCSHGLSMSSPKTSGHLLITYSSVLLLSSMERTNRLDKELCDHQI